MITLAIIVITGLTSFYAFNNHELFEKLKFNAYAVKHQKQYYRLFTHSLLHANMMHLFVNMFVLYIFGSNVELFFEHAFGASGTIYYLGLYVGGVIVASLPAQKKHGDNVHYNAVGASGAVAAVLFSHIVLSPLTSIYILFIPIPIPAFIFGVLYLIYEAYLDKRGGDGVAHDAHFWGAIFGFVFVIILDYRFLFNFMEEVKKYITEF